MSLSNLFSIFYLPQEKNNISVSQNSPPDLFKFETSLSHKQHTLVDCGVYTIGSFKLAYFRDIFIGLA